ncbi:hypothetical protein CASFOL_006091 [Castilleja foliolosa]|uniref:Uncharacterized protein n=1 Tax=Castilleja foliolosa TaxID=1961234 RepID=A0ABD3E5B2_9LAMI
MMTQKLLKGITYPNYPDVIEANDVNKWESIPVYYFDFVQLEKLEDRLAKGSPLSDPITEIVQTTEKKTGNTLHLRRVIIMNENDRDCSKNRRGGVSEVGSFSSHQRWLNSQDQNGCDGGREVSEVTVWLPGEGDDCNAEAASSLYFL